MGSHQQTITIKMGEGNKQVRVDNWGIFFLQRLQLFFNKTDYCDLTLQFEGNVQLKVHRLVMNACTEYFQVLEQTCEMMDDILIMPSDLQADVVLPIVNFMYTGMLEFHMSIFDKLYKTANLMNITVLTKLLDAQKIPIAPLSKSMHKKHSQLPHTWNLQGKKICAKTIDSDLPAPLPGRKLPVWKRKSAPTGVPHTVFPHFYPEQKRTVPSDPLAGYDNAPKPTRFEWPEEDLSSLNFDSNFDVISYTSKPLLTQEEEPKPSTSFDRLKETPDSFQQQSSNYDGSNHNDVDDDYVKEQKIRITLNTDYDEEEAVDDDFEDGELSNQKKRKKIIEISSGTKRVRFNVNEKENQGKQTKINITPTGKISSDVDHTKIISEVLKKYPNLVKKNKNIRLKILAKSNVSPEQIKKTAFKKVTKLQTITTPISNKVKATSVVEENDEDGPWKCPKCSTPSETVEFVLYYLYRKHMTDVHNEKFDSCMCKFCGHKSIKHNMLVYHQYTKHGVKPPPTYDFPKCNKCPYIALTTALLTRHKMNHTKYELQCVECKIAFANESALTSHLQITGHNAKFTKPNYDCQYCTKKFASSSSVFSHIRLHHRDEARRDGIVSIDEFEEANDEEEQEEESETEEYITSDLPANKKEKIKILSNVKLPTVDVQSNSSNTQENAVPMEASSEAEALSNVASGIATSLGLVDVVVLDENQQYILHTNSQENIDRGESEFILPDMDDTQTFTTQQVISSEPNVITQSMLHSANIGSTDELVMVLTDHDYRDGGNEIMNNENSNIVVLYSHPIEGQENQFITSQGNLMLTSPSGLIELRNGNSLVTTTAPHFITSTSDNSDNSHIESIEMIQREINQHPNVAPEGKSTVDSITTQQQELGEQSGTDDVQNEPEEPMEEVVQFNNLEDIVMVQETDGERSTEEIDQTGGEPSEPNESTINEAENTDNVVMEHSVITQHIEEESAKTADKDVEEIMETEQTEAASPHEESIEEEAPGHVEEHEATEPVNNGTTESVEETDHTGVDDENESQETRTIETSDDDPKQSVVEGSQAVTEELNTSVDELNKTADETTEELNTDTTISQPLEDSLVEETNERSEAAEVDETEISCTEEENVETTTNEINSEVNEVEANTNEEHLDNENSQSSDENQGTQPSVNEDDNSNSKPVENFQESSSNSATYSRNNSNQSAKIILDDWEDTDSQQSDSKTGTVVHKLIDDWDDDDEEIKKTTV